jgi:hypothetical protein
MVSSQGQVQSAYFTEAVNSTFQNQTTGYAPSIPQSNLPSMTNYQLINLKTTDVRAISVIDGPSDLTMFEILGSDGLRNPANSSEGWYTVITGAAPSSAVVSITFTYNVEFMPTASSLPLLNVLYAEPGPATLSFISNLIKAAPEILRMDLAEAMKLAKFVNSFESVKHDYVLNAVLDWIDRIPQKPINSQPYTYGNCGVASKVVPLSAAEERSGVPAIFPAEPELQLYEPNQSFTSEAPIDREQRLEPFRSGPTIITS